ncbi:MAG TPA: type II toxin-antitoxin system HicB family antitoxin [Candidatus Acidoferrum sp.]|nr:type II toxin-antitoxin system HicB family antitoxin [Candidatus Acidoferrum sp.]
MTYYTYPISIEKEDGQYYAYSDDLPGVYGLGDTIDEAKASMLEGIRLYIEECKKDGKPIPAARTVYTETVSVAVE